MRNISGQSSQITVTYAASAACSNAKMMKTDQRIAAALVRTRMVTKSSVPTDASSSQGYAFRTAPDESAFRCSIFAAMFTELRQVTRQDLQPPQAARPLALAMAAIVSAASE